MEKIEKLAILGGKPILKNPFPESNNIDDKEKKAVMEVLDSGVLSDYVGRAGDKFLGGAKVKELEEDFHKKFNTKYAVSFNSATTALEAAVCALGLGPGDEVIVSPYTMSASATAVLMNNSIPIFADIEEDTFCLDPKSIKERITDKTKAIMVTNLFGGSARYDEILKIAEEHDLKIIEDNAQAPGGKYKGEYLGNVGDIGVFSFNFHKVIHSGEGGVLITDNKRYAYRAQLKRNHGEAVLDDLDVHDEPVLGSNYRLSEVHSAIAIEQLKKLDSLNDRRIELANYLTEKLKAIDGFTPAYVLPDTKHVYYVYPIKYDEKKTGIPRELFAEAMLKEGFPLNQGYIKPVHLLPLFTDKKMFTKTNCPYDCLHYTNTPEYKEGLCPVTERFWEKEFIFTTICRYPLTKKHVDLFIHAIEKILKYKSELMKIE